MQARRIVNRLTGSIAAKRAMNILLLNLTRFGDLLQSQAGITDLVEQGHRVGLVCLENFDRAAGLLAGVSHIAPLPSSFLLVKLEENAAAVSAAAPKDRKRGWSAALASLSAWRDALYAAFTPDVVCNLTPSLPARMLALFLARSRPCTGFAVDEHGFGLNSNAWAAFLQGASTVRGVSPFNLVDVFRRVAAPGSRSDKAGNVALALPAQAKRENMLGRLNQAAPASHRGFVALQLGAREERRRWPTPFFAAFGDTLWDKAGFFPVLLGGKGENPLAEEYAATAAHPFLNLCGKTDMEELAAVLCSVRLLATNDTGTMHLAAGLGVPVLAVFLATAQPFDTGPYLADSCSLEPDLPCHPCAFGAKCGHGLACRQAVPPALAAALALSRLETGEWRMPPAPAKPPASPEVDRPFGAGRARVWRSRFDEQGFMDLVSLSGHEGTPRTIWFARQRPHLRRFLDKERGEPFTPVPRANALPPLPGELAAALRSAAGRAIRLIPLLVQQGNTLAASPVPLMRRRFFATWDKVRNALEAEPCLAALAMLWVQETQDSGQDLPCVLQGAEQFGRLLEALCED